MKVYISNGREDYESDEQLGCFDNPEVAVALCISHGTNNPDKFDFYHVYWMEINTENMGPFWNIEEGHSL